MTRNENRMVRCSLQRWLACLLADRLFQGVEEGNKSHYSVLWTCQHEKPRDIFQTESRCMQANKLEESDRIVLACIQNRRNLAGEEPMVQIRSHRDIQLEFVWYTDRWRNNHRNKIQEIVGNREDSVVITNNHQLDSLVQSIIRSFSKEWLCLRHNDLCMVHLGMVQTLNKQHLHIQK